MYAVFGGSFDPPTLGHLMVVSHLLLNEPSVSGVVVIPCYSQVGKSLRPFEHRLEMCYRTFSVLSRVDVSPIERELPPEHAGITVELLKLLKLRNPDRQFRFIMGADLLMSAPKWEGWDEICELAPPLIIGRAAVPNLSNDAPSPITPIVSSTIVRTLLAEGDYDNVARYITQDTLNYIIEHDLYKTSVGSI